MKYLILIIAIAPLYSFSCTNKIPLSTAMFAIENNGVGLEKEMDCKKLPDEECLCFDGISWDTAEIKTEFHRNNLGINVEKKVLKNSEVKEAERMVERQVERDKLEQKKLKKKEAKQLLKDLDFENATTLVKLRPIIKALIEAQDD